MMMMVVVVGVLGLEPRASRSRTARCHLRHAPMLVMMVGEEGDDPPASRPPAARSAC